MTCPHAAVVLAGGLGTRMLPLTANRPKHLLDVAGEPLLGHTLRWLARAGVTQVTLATAHLAEQFGPALGDGEAYGVRLTFVAEPHPLGTGGALAHAASALARLGVGPEEPVVVVNGDLVSAHDLAGQVATLLHGPTEVTGILHVRRVPDARAFGCVVARSDGLVTGFREKDPHPPTNDVNAGTYVLRRKVLDTIPTGRVVSLEREVLPVLAISGRLRAFRQQAYWLDVGTPASLVRASADVVTGRHPVPWRAPAAALVAPGARVHPSATLEQGTSVLAGAVIGAGARVTASIVMAGAVIGRAARVVDSVVGRRARVPAGAELVDGVLGDDQHLTR